MWLDRPLSVTQLQYSAGDIQLIAQIYSTFVEKGFIDEPKLLQQGERYVSLRGESLGGINDAHPLLPLGILSQPPSWEFTHVCSTCKRSLSLSSFSKARKNCWVCRAVSVRPSRRYSDDDYCFADEFDD